MVPAGFLKRLKDEYPNLTVRFNSNRACFEVVEKFYRGVVPEERVIWQYENCDGTPMPFSQDHCMEFLHSIDTKKWPLKDRVRLWREERKKREAGEHAAMLKKVHDYVGDNEIYFSSSERFFMGPNMPEWKTKFMPSQARALQRLKAA